MEEVSAGALRRCETELMKRRGSNGDGEVMTNGRNGQELVAEADNP